MVFCLEQGADLHMAQLMPLPLTVSCFSKLQTGFTFLVPAHPGSPGQRAVKRACVLYLLLSDAAVSVQEWSESTAGRLSEASVAAGARSGRRVWGSQSATRWSCSLCGAWLGSARTLRNHVRKKHMALKTERCRLCGETFRWSGQVARHKRRCHPESVS